MTTPVPPARPRCGQIMGWVAKSVLTSSPSVGAPQAVCVAGERVSPPIFSSKPPSCFPGLRLGPSVQALINRNRGAECPAGLLRP